jgi:hypothetical protein
MLIIDYVDTNDVTKFTDVRMRYQKLGKHDIECHQLTFRDRYDAINYVRSSVKSYFVTNVERYMKGCEHAHEQYNERFGESKQKAYAIIDRYHLYICSNRSKWPEPLQFYLRIHDEFKRLLPATSNPYHRLLKAQLETFQSLAQEFFIEFSNNSHLLEKYQPKTTAKAS